MNPVPWNDLHADIGAIAANICLLNVGAVVSATPAPTNPWVIGRTVAQLHKGGQSLHKWYERACNESLSDKQYRFLDRKEAQLAKLAEDVGIRIELNRDPRGWPVILYVGSSEYRLGGRNA